MRSYALFRRPDLTTILLVLAAFITTWPVPTGAAPAQASDGQRSLTVSETVGLADGQTVTVSGSGYDANKGIYVAVCIVPPGGGVPGPCGGGQDLTGGTGASAWISSNPPSYGAGLAVPYGPGGSFQVQIGVGILISSGIDCRQQQCAVVTRNDHLNSGDRSQDLYVPITFAGQASQELQSQPAQTAPSQPEQTAPPAIEVTIPHDSTPPSSNEDFPPVETSAVTEQRGASITTTSTTELMAPKEEVRPGLSQPMSRSTATNDGSGRDRNASSLALPSGDSPDGMPTGLILLGVLGALFGFGALGLGAVRRFRAMAGQTNPTNTGGSE